MRDNQSTYVLRSPWDEVWYVAFDEVFSWVTENSEGPTRNVTFGFHEQDKPVGAIQAAIVGGGGGIGLDIYGDGYFDTY
jgi:hypothetical protein